MGLMTSTQANACKIIRMEKRTYDSVVSWIVAVNDEDGNYYDMELSEIGDDPSKADIKSAILSTLLTMSKQPAPITETIIPVTDKGLDETVG